MEGTIQQQQKPNAGKPSIFSNKKVLYAAVAAVIVIVGAALALGNGGGGNSGLQLAQFDGRPVPQSVLSLLEVPNSVSSAVGAGFATNFPKKTANAQQLSINGKPEVLYIGAEYCPYCAVQRWPLIIALVRFGSFTGLRYMTSSATDSYANTPTFTFAGSTYTSPYIAFVSKELTTNVYNASIGNYPQLQQLNASEQAIYAKYNPVGSIPFTDYANVSYDVGGNYGDPTILDSMNWSAIAGRLNNANTTQSQALVGAANLVTAQICKLDNNTPSSVCGQAYITSLESELG